MVEEIKKLMEINFSFKDS